MTYLIDVQGAGVSYPLPEDKRKVVLHDIHLQVKPGEFCTVVGPSGCGKSTLLRLIWGTQFPNEGRVLIEGDPVSGVTRNCGIVFQNYSLFSFLTVLENIAFGRILEQTTLTNRVLAKPLQVIDWSLDWLVDAGYFFANLMVGGMFARAGLKGPNARFKRSRERPWWRRFFERINKFYRVRNESRDDARELMKSVGLDENDGDKYPYELSGGMKQRVAIAQAILMEPKILLMDEPFGALDAQTRTNMQDFIHDCWQKFGLTVFFVTHDLDEAVRLGTRLICVSQYWTDESGTPGVGARVVRDRHIEGGSTRPSEFHGSEEYQRLIADISRAGLNSQRLIPIASFDLSHTDAAVPGTDKGAIA